MRRAGVRARCASRCSASTRSDISPAICQLRRDLASPPQLSNEPQRRRDDLIIDLRGVQLHIHRLAHRDLGRADVTGQECIDEHALELLDPRSAYSTRVVAVLVAHRAIQSDPTPNRWLTQILWQAGATRSACAAAHAPGGLGPRHGAHRDCGVSVRGSACGEVQPLDLTVSAVRGPLGAGRVIVSVPTVGPHAGPTRSLVVEIRRVGSIGLDRKASAPTCRACSWVGSGEIAISAGRPRSLRERHNRSPLRRRRGDRQSPAADATARTSQHLRRVKDAFDLVTLGVQKACRQVRAEPVSLDEQHP